MLVAYCYITMNRTPAHRIFSFAIALAFVFSAVAFSTIPFFSDTTGAVNIARAQFGEAPQEAPGAATPGRRADRGDAPTRIKEIDEYSDAAKSVETNQASFTKISFDNQIAHTYCTIVGGCFEGVDSDGNQTSGIVPGLGKAIGYLYTAPPATTQQYVAYVLNSAGVNIAQPAYAQVGGLGFSSLLPILDTWVRMRNVAYLFFVIMFVVIGFMIMFRQKLGGQTVVTIQQAIPQIIISLLAVTFSFAIAGLLIDMMYISMYLLLALFGQTQENQYFNGSLFVIHGTLITQGIGSVNESVMQLVTSVIGTDGFNRLLIGGAGLGGALIFAVVMTIRLFQLFFDLLLTYIGIIVSIVTAPIALMLGAVPGKSHFTTWVKGLIGNLAAFPAVLFVLLLYQSLTENTLASNGANGSGFLPPYLVGNGSSEAVANLIGVGIIIILPTIVKEVKGAFGAKEGVFSQFGKAITDSISAGWKGNKYIPGAKSIMKTGATVGAMGAGAGIGAGWAAARGRDGKTIRNRAIIGAASPIALRLAPGLAKKSISLGKEQVSQLITAKTFGVVDQKRKEFNREREDRRAKDVQSSAADNTHIPRSFRDIPNDVSNPNTNEKFRPNNPVDDDGDGYTGL